jgi:hypothetical protein
MGHRQNEKKDLIRSQDRTIFVRIFLEIIPDQNLQNLPKFKQENMQNSYEKVLLTQHLLLSDFSFAIMKSKRNFIFHLQPSKIQ